MPKVTVIPATRDFHTGAIKNSIYRKKVAAYARVSTDHEEQRTSYEAQVDYYTKYIQGRADWDFVKVYTDEGITATNTKHREGFNDMIADALAGKIDLIITKSVSRFARNTVDSLTSNVLDVVKIYVENGKLIKMEFTMSWGTITMSVTYTFTDYGMTVIDVPEWTVAT